MTSLLFWLGGCAILCWAFKDFIAVPLSLIILTYIAVPSQAEGLILPRIHPASWFLIVLLVIVISYHWDELREVLRRTNPMRIMIVVLIAYSSLDLVNPQGGSRVGDYVPFVIKVLILPYVLYALVRVALAMDGQRARRWILWSLFAMGVFQAYLSFLQVSTEGREGYLWRHYYERSWWWVDDWHIGMGTTAHPLQMGLFLASLVPLLALIRSQVIRYGAVLAYLYGISSATARTGMVLAVAGVVFLVITGIRRALTTIAVISMSVPLVLAFLASRAFDRLLKKFQSDEGSAQMRADAFHWAVAHYHDFLIFGYPGARDLRTTGVLRSSLENGYLVAGLNFGLVFAALVLIYHLGCLLVPLPKVRWSTLPYLMACVFTMVGFNGSGSFMYGGLEGTTAWVFFALYHDAVLGGTRRAESTRREDEVEPKTPEPVTGVSLA